MRKFLVLCISTLTLVGCGDTMSTVSIHLQTYNLSSDKQVITQLEAKDAGPVINPKNSYAFVAEILVPDQTDVSSMVYPNPNDNVRVQVSLTVRDVSKEGKILVEPISCWAGAKMITKLLYDPSSQYRPLHCEYS
jgi:uncharacterized protein YcfL